MLRQGQCILRRFGQQQVNLTHAAQAFTQHQAQLQLQGNAAVCHFDLQGVTQCTQQLAAANGVGQVVVAAVFTVEQHQCAAIVQRMQFALVQRGCLVQTITIAFQQFHQSGAGQAAQLLLCPQLHREYGTRLRRRRCDRFWFGQGNRRGTRRAGVAQVGKRVFVVVLVFFGAHQLSRCSLGRRCRCSLIERRVTQVAHFKARLVVFGLFVVAVVVVVFFWFRLGLWRRRGQAGVELTSQVADLILTLDGRGVRIGFAQPYPQLQQGRGDMTAQTQA